MLGIMHEGSDTSSRFIFRSVNVQSCAAQISAA